jgi:hypothetical protein
MIESHSGANKVVVALTENGMAIAINGKHYEIALDAAQSATLGIMLMRQADEVSKLENGNPETEAEI